MPVSATRLASGSPMPRARSAGVWDSVAFVPPQSIRGVLARGRVMVIPSLAESLPYVILEAAAAAQPLVSTNVGGIPEIFGPYADQLIEPGHPEILARRIMEVMGEPEETRTRRARELSAYVETRFCIDGMVEAVLGAYREALAARGGMRAL